MNFLFIITSAVNTKFGVYTREQRLDQLMDTIESIHNRVENPGIFVAESSAIPLDKDQVSKITSRVNKIFDFGTDTAVKELFDSTDNWDVVKNVTEVMCFGQLLSTAYEGNLLSPFDRIFKISGRYVLNDKFDIDIYEEYKNQNMIMIGPEKMSQFDFNVTHVARQHMSRLWSWPKNLTPEIIDFYSQSLKFMYERLSCGGYVDIEHCLYKFLDRRKIFTVSQLGIEGNISPNGKPVRD